MTRMRYLADAALHDAQWAMLAGPIAAALPDELIPADLIGASASSPAPRRGAPDALAALIEAGLVAVGEQLPAQQQPSLTFLTLVSQQTPAPAHPR